MNVNTWWEGEVHGPGYGRMVIKELMNSNIKCEEKYDNAPRTMDIGRAGSAFPWISRRKIVAIKPTRTENEQTTVAIQSVEAARLTRVP